MAHRGIQVKMGMSSGHRFPQSPLDKPEAVGKSKIVDQVLLFENFSFFFKHIIS